MTMNGQETMMTDRDMERAIEVLRETDECCAKARAERLYLGEFLKSKKALLMKVHAESVFAMPISTQEREALADPEYLAVLDGYRVAIFEDERQRNKRDTAKAEIDAWRTQSATTRVML
jgi:hypothetical protein